MFRLRIVHNSKVSRPAYHGNEAADEVEPSQDFSSSLELEESEKLINTLQCRTKADLKNFPLISTILTATIAQ